MGIDIEQEEISISHRLQTMNRKPREPRPIIAKFLRRVVKNIHKYKHCVKNSECHYNVFVNEQLTKERSRVVYQLKKMGLPSIRRKDGSTTEKMKRMESLTHLTIY